MSRELTAQDKNFLMGLKAQGINAQDAYFRLDKAKAKIKRKADVEELSRTQEVQPLEEPKAGLSFSPVSTGEPSVFQVGEGRGLLDRAQGAVEGFQEAGAGIQERTAELKERETPERGLASKVLDPLNLSSGKALEAGAIAVGGAADIIGSTIAGFISPEIQSVATTVIENTPEPVKEQAVAAFKKADEVYQELPDSAKNAFFGAGGVFELLVGGVAPKVVKKTGEALDPLVGKTKNIIRERQETKAIEDALNLEQDVKNSIDETINKAIKPRKQLNTDLERVQYQNKSRDAVFTIADNKQNLSFIDKEGDIVKGELPESVQQMSESVTQTKKKIFSEYDSLAKQTGESGSIVSLSPIVLELQKLKDNVVIQDVSPQTSTYIDGLIERFGKRASYTPEQTQDIIQNFNDELKTFYRNPSTGQGSKAVVDSMVANKLRLDLDDTIENVTGEKYQALKNQYGSLKQIERDVVRAAQRVANKNGAGLVDAMSGIASASQVAQFLTTGGVSNIAQAAATEGVRRWWNLINSPDRSVKNMFKQVDEFNKKKTKVGAEKLIKKTEEPTRQGRFTGTRGAIGKDVNQSLSKPATAQTRLIEEAKKFDTFEEFIKDQRKDFHGTSQKFDTFDAKQLNTSTNTLAGEEGFWFTDSSKEAKDFAGLSGKRLAKDNVAFEAKSDDLANKLDAAEKKRDFDLVDDITSQIEKHEASLLTDKPDEFVLERFLTTDNPKVVDMKGKSSVQGELSRIIKEAKKEGHDAVVFQNISDNPLSTDVVTNQTIVFDTKSIKTKDQLKDIFNQAKSSQ